MNSPGNRSQQNQCSISPVRIKIEMIQRYPFSLSQVTNIMQLTYTCFASEKVCRILKIQDVGYRWINNNKGFQHVILIIKDQNLSKKQKRSKKIVEQQSQFLNEKDQIQTGQYPIVYVPFNIYHKVLEFSNCTKYNQSFQDILLVNTYRFPVSLGQNMQFLSFTEQAQTLNITNISTATPEVKDLIAKIIYYPHQKPNNKSTTQQDLTMKRIDKEFLIFPTLNNHKIVVDLDWLDQKPFIKCLKSLKLKNQLIKMIKQNFKAFSGKNGKKNYLQFNIKYSTSNIKEKLSQANINTTQIPIVVKFIPGKTKIEFSSSSLLHQPSLEPFFKNTRLTQLYFHIYNSYDFYKDLHDKMQNYMCSSFSGNHLELQTYFVCLKTDKSIGLSSFFHQFAQKTLNKRFIKIDCEKFATKTQFQNRIKKCPNEGSSLIFIKNLPWIQNLTKHEDIVPQNMKTIIERLYVLLKESYKNTLKNFTCIIYFSTGQLPQQLPYDSFRLQTHISKDQKLKILKNIFYVIQKQNKEGRLKINSQIQQTITNMLINSFGWTKIYKFLKSIKKELFYQHITQKEIAKIIQKKFNLENVENVADVSWDDIGGLQTAKEEIIQTVLLPTKHPEIFDEWIKPRTGLLFYGPPGTGKTLLGKCIAKQCKMGFISVKGPQLLNMYVGESQKNVRQIFQRAKQSRPCIVFMDQLDALVPKRGNSSDSNQVMDRIVAELLTQMDLASQNQIFIIGATNRPDLLDPSILRAGRFDKQIYLGITRNPQDRVKILKAQTRNSKLQKDFNYQKVISKVPQNFTGADFYGLSSKAMMKAVQRSIGKFQKNQEQDPQVLITQQDFLDVIQKIKPSVSTQELAHYQSLKQKFS